MVLYIRKTKIHENKVEKNEEIAKSIASINWAIFA